MPFNTATRGDGRTDNQGTDVLPITPADNLNAESFTYDDLLAVKKVADTDVCFCSTKKKLANWYYLRYLQTRLWRKNYWHNNSNISLIVAYSIYLTQTFMY